MASQVTSSVTQSITSIKTGAKGREHGKCHISSQDRLQKWSRKPVRLSAALDIRVTDSTETRIKNSKKSSVMML